MLAEDELYITDQSHLTSAKMASFLQNCATSITKHPHYVGFLVTLLNQLLQISYVNPPYQVVIYLVSL